jgi:hypothetical protein
MLDQAPQPPMVTEKLPMVRKKQFDFLSSLYVVYNFSFVDFLTEKNLYLYIEYIFIAVIKNIC